MTGDQARTDDEPLLVGIGTSAGGSEPLATVLSGLGDAAGIALIVVKHITGDACSSIEGLERSTALPVELVTSRTRIAAGRVYLAAGHCELTVDGDWLVPAERTADDVPPARIDHFFESLAKSRASDAVGIVLSGAGSDGTLGLKAIEEAGGMTIAQMPETADHGAMPKNAIASGVVDHVLAPEAIAVELAAYRDHLRSLSLAERNTEQREAIVAALPTVAELLEQQTRHDFRHYKTSTLVRRIQRRMQVCRVRSVDDYIERLREQSDEVEALYGELLIGVTHFFRDPDAFEKLDELVIGPLMSEPRRLIRAWVAGCATGEEAYSLAILFRERMDAMADPPDVQIFATDIDARALDHARKAVYSGGIAERMSPERLEGHFIKRSRRYHVKKEVRKLCMFSAHNLIGDPPFSRLDLICCRNVLIYLGSHLQRKLIPVFHYALSPKGHLFLGPSENVSSHRDLFRLVDTKHRIARRRAVASEGARVRPRISPLPEVHPAKRIIDREPDLHQIAERIVVDEFTPEWAIVDDEGHVVSLSESVSRYLELSGGQFHNNVIRMAKSGLRMALKESLALARHERRRVRRDDLVVPDDGASDRVTLTVQPMPRLGEDAALYLVVFQVTGEATVPERAAEAEGRGPQAEVDELERELRATRRDLERSIAHLESANEELKSSNEELVSMNEELQSANEELETSQEEVQASNEALARAKSDLENVLRSTQIATLFLDAGQRIRSFTRAASEIYNLMDGDVGRPLWHITHHAIAMPPLPTVEELEETAGRHEAIVETRDGRFFSRRVLPYQSGDGPSGDIVVTFVDITPLRLSEKRNSTLVSISSQIVWTTDAQGRATTDSPSWRAFTGQSVEQWLGSGWLDAVHPDDREAAESQWKEAVTSKSELAMEYRLMHVSGEYRYNHVRAAPIFDPDRSVREWIGMNTDVHERRTAEAAVERTARRLAEAERRLKLALRSNEIMAFDWYVAEDAVEEPFRSEDDVAGSVQRAAPRRFDDLVADVHPEDRDAFRAAIGRALDNGSYEVELRRVGTGEVRWVHERGHVSYHEDGSPVRLFALSLDMTNRRRAQEAKAWLAALIEHSDDAILSKTLDGIITSWNRGAERLYGYSAEEVVGRNVSLLVPDEAHDDVAEILARLRRGELVKDYETVRQTKDGEQRLVSLTVSVVRDDDGAIVGASTIARDITEQKAAQAALEEASRRKDEFLAVLGHELRNPLAAMRSATELLQVASAKDPRLSRVHGALDRQVARMVRIVDGLLEISRMARGKITLERQPVDVAELVRQVCEDRRGPIAASEVELVVELPESPVWVPGDAIRLVQIFDNLLSNAAKFTPAGGRIHVTMTRLDERVAVSVRDTGSGIDSEMLDRIFEPFEQQSHGGEGLGLGLSLVRGLVELHQGEVEARSDGPGSGAELVVRLPLTDPPMASEDEREEGEGRRYRILVLEDHLDAAEMLEGLLSSRGHEVVVMNDGAEGVKALREHEVDLVLCDIGLPTLTGYDVARAVRADDDLEDTVMVAMTGYGQAHDRDEAMAAGFDAYLTKPVAVDELERTIREILATR